MAFLFSKPLTPAEQLKKHKREIDRAVRDLERERNKLQMNEKKIITELVDGIMSTIVKHN